MWVFFAKLNILAAERVVLHIYIWYNQDTPMGHKKVSCLVRFISWFEMHAGVALGVGKYVLFREMSSVQGSGI